MKIAGLFLAMALILSACSEKAVQSPTPAPREIPVLNLPFSLLSTPDDLVNLDSILMIQCGPFVGTAEIISDTHIITAYHVVVEQSHCGVRNVLAPVVYRSKEQDFAVLEYHAPRGSERFPIDCGGFVTGETYLMIGYKGGEKFVLNRATATANFEDSEDLRTKQPFLHVRVLEGRVHPGMSGGAVIDSRGHLVGIINATSTNPAETKKTFSRELKDTYLCNEASNK